MKYSSRMAVILAVVASMAACKEDERYSVDNIKNVDTQMKIFENGLEIPLIKNSLEIRADSLLNRLELEDSLMQYLTVGADGKYHITYGGAMSLDSLIDSFGIDSLLKIDGISFDSSFDFHIGDFDAEDIKSPASDFGHEMSLPDFSRVIDLSIDPVSHSFSTASGISGLDFDIAASIPSASREVELCSKTDLHTLASAAQGLGLSEVTIPERQITLDVEPYDIASFVKPSRLKKVSGVTLSPSARIAVTLSIVPNILSSGSVTTTLAADMGDLLVFEGGSSVLNLGNVSLDASNGYSVTNYYPVSALNVEKLFSARQVILDGDITINGKASTAAALSATEDLKVSVSIAFENFEIESVQCELDDIRATVSEDVSISIPDIILPSEAAGVDWVSFTDDSRISLSISSENEIEGLGIKADTIRISFPPELEVSGQNVSDNVLTITGADVLAGLNRDVKISRLNLPAAKDGKVSYAAVAKAFASCTASGTVDTKDIKALSGKDVNIISRFIGNISVSDFSVRTNAIEKSIPDVSGNISFDIPDEAASYGTFTVVPQGTPKISIVADIPDLGGLSITSPEGIKVTLPEFIKFGTVPTSQNYSFNAATNTLVLNKIVSESIDLPIESLSLTPVKENGAYKVKGGYGLEGAAVVAASTVGKSALDKISGASIRFNASIPEIKAATIAVDSLSFPIDETVVFKVSGFESVPEMLLEIGEVLLDDVNANLSINLSGLPSIGSGKYMVDVTAYLPDFIDPEMIPIKGEIKDGKFTADEVSVKGFDFSGRDIQKMRQDDETLSDSIRISGRIYAQNPSVDISTLSSSVRGKLTADICDDNEQIGLKSMAARLDYKLDTLFSVPFPALPEMLSEINFDFPAVSAVIGIGSNLGVPFGANASIIPLKDGLEDASKGVFINDLKFPYSENPAVADSVTNTLSLDLNPVLNAAADSLHIRFAADTDPSRLVTLNTAADYTLHIGYDIDAALELGEGFGIEFCDTVELSNAAGYIETFLPNSSLAIGGTVANALPVGVSVKLDFFAYDAQNDSYRHIDIESVSSDVITAGSESEFLLRVGPSGDADLEGISHMRIKAVLSSNGEALRPESSISLRNVYLCIPEGLSIDPEGM